jgi:hypothetical protein
MPTSPTPDDLLALARFCKAEKWHEVFCRNLSGVSGEGAQRSAVSAAEAVLIERGLGEEYGAELVAELGVARGERLDWEFEWAASVAAIRTAPLDVCVRAMVQVVKQQQKETK